MTNNTTTKIDSSPNKEETWELILFVVTKSAKSRRMYIDLKQICEKHLSGLYHLDLVDIMEMPEQANEFDIIATPTLLRKSPSPKRKVVGDLSHTQKVLSALGLSLD